MQHTECVSWHLSNELSAVWPGLNRISAVTPGKLVLASSALLPPSSPALLDSGLISSRHSHLPLSALQKCIASTFSFCYSYKILVLHKKKF